MKEDICLAICKLLKQPKTVRADENKLLLDDTERWDRQSDSLFKAQGLRVTGKDMYESDSEEEMIVLYLHSHLCKLT